MRGIWVCIIIWVVVGGIVWVIRKVIWVVVRVIVWSIRKVI